MYRKLAYSVKELTKKLLKDRIICIELRDLLVMEDKKIRSNIKALREKKGISQMELAKKVGVSHTTARNWDHGRTGLEVFDLVARLCEALDCQAKDLIITEKSKSQTQSKPTSTSINGSSRLSTGELCEVLGVTPNAIKQAISKGVVYFAAYTREKCGIAYRAINVAKPGAKIPRWKFEEIN